MARRTFRYNKELDKFVEIVPGQDFESPQFSEGLLWGDRSYEGLRATDGADISSRTKHREYMRQHGLTTMDDYKGHFQKEAQRRAEYFTTGKGGATRHEDVARAIHQLENKK